MVMSNCLPPNSVPKVSKVTMAKMCLWILKQFQFETITKLMVMTAILPMSVLSFPRTQPEEMMTNPVMEAEWSGPYARK